MSQGAVLSLILFNMAMAEPAFRLDEVEGLGVTIYADDVTFWASGAPLAAQQATLQYALDVTVEFLEGAGMGLSPDKPNYVIVARRQWRPKYFGNIFKLQY